MEHFNPTIVDRLRHYAGEHQNDWDIYVQSLTYAYSAQVLKLTKTTPLSLVLTREPPGAANIVSPSFMTKTDNSSNLAIKRTIMTKMNSLKRTTKAAIEKIQAQHQSKCDGNARKHSQLSSEDLVFIDEPPTPGQPTDDNPTHKLRPKKHGYYSVIVVQWNTVTADVDGIGKVDSSHFQCTVTRQELNCDTSNT